MILEQRVGFRQRGESNLFLYSSTSRKTRIECQVIFRSYVLAGTFHFQRRGSVKHPQPILVVVVMVLTGGNVSQIIARMLQTGILDVGYLRVRANCR
jgi:hypothetical protein